MVKLTLQIKATLENLKNLTLPTSAEWHFKIECGTCHEQSPNPVWFVPDQIQDMQNSKGQCNLQYKCKGCDRSGTIEFIQKSEKLYSASEEWGDLASFECRGLEPVQFFPGDNFTAMGIESETMFGQGFSEEAVELMDKMWAGYDEEADESVSIMDFESQIVRAGK